MTRLFREDKDPRKVSLGVGVYRTDNGEPYLFKTVQKVEEILAKEALDRDYPPIDGDANFLKSARKLAFGINNVNNQKITSVQTISGAGAVYTAFKLINKFLHKNPFDVDFYLSDPSWPLYSGILQEIGIKNIHYYPYYDYKRVCLNFEGMIEKLQSQQVIPSKSCIILQVSGHNPTGFDLTREQWKIIAEICKKRNLLPFLDMAYQGFATGNMENDSWAVRYFLENNNEFFLGQSFSKNAGLYAERVGALHCISSTSQKSEILKSQLMKIIRMTHSTCPIHGARIITKIVNNPEFYQEWIAELAEVSKRIIQIRQLLYEELCTLKTPGKWEHFVQQTGMFSYSGLNKEQCQKMVKKHHIYMLDNGRMSMSGINTKNVKYVAKAIHEVTTSN